MKRTLSTIRKAPFYTKYMYDNVWAEVHNLSSGVSLLKEINGEVYEICEQERTAEEQEFCTLVLEEAIRRALLW